MSAKVSALKRAVKVAKQAMRPGQYGVDGKPFVCLLCGHDRFALGPNLYILSLRTLACADCGHVEFFVKLPPMIDA